MATTTEGTGNGSVDRFLPRLLNGVAKIENVPALSRVTEKLGEATVEFHVAKNGVEDATGSQTYPFPTIQEAVDYAEENVEGDLAYVVNVHPGFYP